MNKIKNMILIFDWEWFERVHLYKDVGMIPIYLQRLYGIEANILFYSSQTNIDLKSKEMGINLVRLNKNFLNKIKFLRRFITPMILYLIKNAKKTDMLMLFHIKEANYLYRKIYKFLNPKGKVYLKLDIDLNGLDSLEKNYSYSKKSKKIGEIRYGLREYLNRFVRSYRIKKIHKQLELFDLVSVETYYGLEKLNELININQNINIMKITNGFSNETEKKISGKKENKIITVGRIGSFQKNNEFLLDCIKDIDLKDWKIYFVGPIENEFNKVIEDFYKQFPEKKTNVIFTGKITNKEELFYIYDSSKVFCLTSRWEGFPLVFPEALYFGNYIISTEIGAEKDIIINDKIGKIIKQNDKIALKVGLQNIINGKVRLDNFTDEIKRHSEDNFMWEKIVTQLYERI